LSVGFDRLSSVENALARNEFVTEALHSRSIDLPSKKLLDVGAGEMPYKSMARELGFLYRSHDFAQYDGHGDWLGLQNDSWRTTGHDVVCDILEIPDSEQAGVILCTEVLEHVPDPVRAFQKLADLCLPGGRLIVTVPFLSLMHQSPYWFQSGLSPYWFQFWSRKCSLEVESLTVSGDYADLMLQELRRSGTVYVGFRARLLARLTTRLIRDIRRKASVDLLLSGGFNTFFIGRKVDTFGSAL
jgi:SAM-dependent methyltransferase